MEKNSSSGVPWIQQFQISIFLKTLGLKVDVPDGVDPILCMKFLLTDDIVAEIKDNSNHYAERVIESSRPLRRRSVLHKWTPITDDEMRKFIGLVLHIGLVGMHSYKHYWRKDTLFRNTFFFISHESR